MLNLLTKFFGSVDYEPNEVVHFPTGPFGFEDEHDFLILPFEGGAGSLLCFQSVNTPALAFVAMNPFSLLPDYSPTLQPQELKALGVQDSHELAYYVLCVVKKPVSESTVNLKCPVAVHPDSRLARQVILDTDQYEMRHPLSQFATKGGPPC